MGCNRNDPLDKVARSDSHDHCFHQHTLAPCQEGHFARTQASCSSKSARLHDICSPSCSASSCSALLQGRPDLQASSPAWRRTSQTLSRRPQAHRQVRGDTAADKTSRERTRAPGYRGSRRTLATLRSLPSCCTRHTTYLLPGCACAQRRSWQVPLDLGWNGATIPMYCTMTPRSDATRRSSSATRTRRRSTPLAPYVPHLNVPP